MVRSTKSWTVDHTYDDVAYLYDSSVDSKRETDDSISTISGGSKLPEYAEDPFTLLESKAERKKRKRSHMVAYATMFVITVGFSVVLSGVWPYLHELDKDLTKESLGWVVAANPLGQMIASPVVGYIGNRLGGIRIVCYFTMTFFILGNLIYSFLPLFQGLWDHSAFHIMIIARFIVGLSSSNVTLCRSYLASSTTTKERTTGIAIISAAQSLGFVIGPAIQMVLSLSIDKELLKYRSTGWVAALLGVINFILLTPCIFQEYNIAEKERNLLKRKDNSDSQVIPKVDYVALFGVLFGFFMNQFIYVLLETLMEPFLTDQYAWCNDIAVVVVGIAFSCAGIWAIAMFITATRLAKRFDERKILIFGAFFPICFGVFLFLPWGPQKLVYCPKENGTTFMSTPTSTPTPTTEPAYFSHFNVPLGVMERRLASLPDSYEPYASNDLYGAVFDVDKWCPGDECLGCPADQVWCEGYDQLPMVQFFVAYSIVISGYPFGVSMSNAIFSKILGPKPQGFWMGILTASGSLSRVLGPIFVSYLYANKGTRWTFSVLFVGMLVAIAELTILFKRIVPMKIKKDNDDKGRN